MRLDNLDDMARKMLHIAAVLGMTFALSEVLEISERILSISQNDKEKHAITIQQSLKAALEEGILDENISDDGDMDSVSSKESALANIVISADVDDCADILDVPLKDISYNFYHDTWRRVIKSVMLDSWIQDIHMHAAMAIETRLPDNEMRDYSTKVKLFQHWKGSENTIRAAEVALDTGKSFKLLGMNLHSIKVYEDAIDMWKRHETVNDEDIVAGKNRCADTPIQCIICFSSGLWLTFDPFI